MDDEGGKQEEDPSKGGEGGEHWMRRRGREALGKKGGGIIEYNTRIQNLDRCHSLPD